MMACVVHERGTSQTIIKLHFHGPCLSLPWKEITKEETADHLWLKAPHYGCHNLAATYTYTTQVKPFISKWPACEIPSWNIYLPDVITNILELGEKLGWIQPGFLLIKMGAGCPCWTIKKFMLMIMEPAYTENRWNGSRSKEGNLVRLNKIAGWTQPILFPQDFSMS